MANVPNLEYVSMKCTAEGYSSYSKPESILRKEIKFFINQILPNRLCLLIDQYCLLLHYNGSTPQQEIPMFSVGISLAHFFSNHFCQFSSRAIRFRS